MLLDKLEEVGAIDPQVALTLIRLCGGFCRLNHLARATPPSLSAKALRMFDEDVRRCFLASTGIDSAGGWYLDAKLNDWWLHSSTWCKTNADKDLWF